MAEDASAVLLIRVWLEGAGGTFRARLSGISGSGDAVTHERTMAVAATTRDVLIAVERWLADFEEAAKPGT